MRRFLILFVVCLLIVPTVLLADMNLEFTAVGHGPLKGELGLPIKMCPLPDGRFAVLDGATKMVSVFSDSGEFEKNISLPKTFQYEVIKNVENFDTTSLNFSLTNLDMVSNSLSEIFFLTETNILKLGSDGTVKDRIGDFEVKSSMITKPVSFDIGDDGNFYVLDKNNCVVVVDTKGKQLRKIGEIGEGKQKVLNPLMVWVEDDLVIVLDDSGKLTASPQTDDNAITVWKRDGTFVREFAAFCDRFEPEDHQIFHSVIGEVSGEDIYLLDLHASLGGMYWTIKHFQTNGDYMKVIKSPVEDMHPVASVIFDIYANGDKLFFCYPFLSKIVSEDGKNEIGKPTEETLTSPYSACPISDSEMIIMESNPLRLHKYDEDGNHIKVATLNTKTHGLPGLEYTVGVDIDFDGENIIVATMDSILMVDPKNLEIEDSIELSRNIDNLALTKAMAESNGVIHVLDTLSQLTSFTKGLPITFDLSESLPDHKFVDIATDLNENILVLSTEKPGIGWFSKSGDYSNFVSLPDVKSPSSICVTDKGLIFVTSLEENKVYNVSKTGSVVWEGGVSEFISKFDTAEDYAATPDYMVYPVKIRTFDNQIAVLDFGNFRALKLSEKEEAAPEKTPAKLVVTQDFIDFGEEIYYPEKIKKIIQIKNTGELPLEGTASTDSKYLSVSPTAIENDTLIIYVTCEFSIDDAWKTISDQTIKIETNGGTEIVKINPMNVVGKIVYMDIGNPIFRVKTVGADRDFETNRAPIIENSRTYVPLRALGDVLGASVDWDGDDRRVTFKLDSNTVELWIGKNVARVNGAEVELTDLPIIVNDSTYVPVRFVSERLGAGVSWIAATRTVEIKYPVAE